MCEWVCCATQEWVSTARILQCTYWMCHEIEVRKGGAKVGTVNIRLPSTLGEKETVAAGTKNIYSVVAG